MTTLLEAPSPNHGTRPEGLAVDTIVLHYTGMASGEAALERLCDPAAEVSAHYLIEEDGRLFRLVPEDRRAWHAGVAFWRGARNLNDRSLGIELVNPGHAFGLRPFAETQMKRVLALLEELRDRHPVPAARVLGHADVAPRRKQDPGELFDWARLAEAGHGLWPRGEWPAPGAPLEREAAMERAEALLAEIGYETGLATGEPGFDPATRAALAAFQRHFRPRAITGQPDGETLARLAAIADLPAKP